MAASNLADPGAFRAFEHEGWQEVAIGYAAAFGSLTPQAIEPLLDAVGAGAGLRLLDLATGPGYAAAAAAQRGAEVLGIDFAAVMIAEARRRHPDLEFREGDAEALDLADERFDAVITNFGTPHFDRPEQVFREAWRVLRPGGRFGFTMWANPESAVGFGILLRAIEAHGTLSVPLPPGPPFFRYSDHDACITALLEAGFTSPRVAEVPQVWRLPTADHLLQAYEQGTVRSAGLIRAQSEAALRAIRAEMREALRAYSRDGGVELPMPAILASAEKPAEPV